MSRVNQVVDFFQNVNVPYSDNEINIMVLLYKKYADEKIPAILNFLFHQNGSCRTKNGIRKYYQNHIAKFCGQRNYLLDADNSYLCVFDFIYYPVDKINRKGRLFLLLDTIKFTPQSSNTSIEVKVNSITAVRWNQQAANSYHLMLDFSSNKIVISDFLAEDYYIVKHYFQVHKKMFHGPLEIESSTKILFMPECKNLIELITSNIKKATKSVWVMTYCFCVKEIAAELAEAKNRGVDIKIIMDSKMLCSYNGFYKDNLSLFTIKTIKKVDEDDQSVHQKLILYDSDLMGHGSANLSYRAANANIEEFTFTYDKDEVDKNVQRFAYLWRTLITYKAPKSL